MLLDLYFFHAFYSPAVAQDHRDRVLPIMTRNLDEGTDFGPIFQATTPQDFAIQVAAAYLEARPATSLNAQPRSRTRLRPNSPTWLGFRKLVSGAPAHCS